MILKNLWDSLREKILHKEAPCCSMCDSACKCGSRSGGNSDRSIFKTAQRYFEEL